MLLITVRVWFGPGRYWPIDRPFHGGHDRLEGFVTRLTLPQAIEKISEYSCAFGGVKKLTGVAYHIVSVCTIDDLTNDQIHDGGMEFVENLKWTDN